MVRRRPKISRRSFVALAPSTLLLLAAGCGPGDEDSAPATAPPSTPTAPPQKPDLSRTVFPALTSDAWETIKPGDAGWKVPELDTAAAFAGSTKSTAFLVVHRGRLMHETYWQGKTANDVRDVRSVTKSVVGLLVGIAQQKGHLKLDEPVSKYAGTGWSKASPEAEAKVTIRHALAMTSGMDTQGQVAAGPGEQWLYNTAVFQQLRPVVEAASGMPLQKFMEETLSSKIGLRSARIQQVSARPLSDGQPELAIEMTPRDMARVGLLMLEGGKWDGAQIVDSAFVKACVTPSQTDNPSYGYLWWLYGQNSYRHPLNDRKQMQATLNANAPSDGFAAVGNSEQRIYVIPSRGIVVVRQGEGAVPVGSLATYAESVLGWDRALWAEIMKAAPSA